MLSLTLGDINLPVEALELPTLGSDIMLLDNTVMGAFGGVFDWSTEHLSFKTSQVTIKASHRRVGFTAHPEKTATARCSVVTGIESVPVLSLHKCCTPPRVRWQGKKTRENISDLRFYLISE